MIISMIEAGSVKSVILEEIKIRLRYNINIFTLFLHLILYQDEKLQQVLNSAVSDLGPPGCWWTVSSRVPSARYVARRGQSMASGTIQHFPSEDQQCFDLWDSSLSAECVRSCFPDQAYGLVFFWGGCAAQQTVSTEL